MQPVELTDGAIRLRLATLDDVDDIVEQCNDPETVRWTTVPAPYGRADAEQFVTDFVPKHWADGSDLTWAIDIEGRFAGSVSLRPEGSTGRAEIGYGLAPWARGRGVMTQAAALALDWGFSADGLGLRAVVWRAHVGNWTSRRVAWRLGFRLEGTVRALCDQRGELRDAWIGTLLAGEPLRPATTWLETPVLGGQSVTLRPLDDGDAEAIAEAFDDPVTQHWFGGLPSPYGVEEARKFVEDRREDAATGRSVHWAVADPAGGPALGLVSIGAFAQHDGGGEIGYWLHPAARGRGVATEAVRLLVRHAFIDESDGGLGLRHLVVAHVEGNDASQKVIERVGFRPMGVERAGDRIRGGVVLDLHWYDLLLDDLPHPS
jgi:RimJ/RimL family protein N-acetyltransferase